MQKIPTKINGLKEISHKYTNYFFDLDGVLWRGNQEIEGSLSTLKYLRSLNKKLYFVTNSSVRDREQLKKRFRKFGLQVNLWYNIRLSNECYPSSYIAGQYLQLKYPQIKNVLCFGSPFLEKELASAGLNVKRISNFPNFQSPINISKQMEQNIQGVVVGWDNEMTFSKSCLIGLHIQKGAKFFGTNPDKFTMIGGFKIPGAGSIIASIQESVGVKAQIMGKPNTFIIEHIIQKQKIDRSLSIMIGDNMQTDITFGSSAGIDTLCVLSGVSKEEEILASEGMRKPTYYSDSIGSKE